MSMGVETKGIPVPAHLQHLSFLRWTNDPTQHAIGQCPRCKKVLRIQTTLRRKLDVRYTRDGLEAYVTFDHMSPDPGVMYHKTYKHYYMQCTNYCFMKGTTATRSIIQFRQVQGQHSDSIRCGAKCRSAKGHTCDCSCAGANHGAGYDLTRPI